MFNRTLPSVLRQAAAGHLTSGSPGTAGLLLDAAIEIERRDQLLDLLQLHIESQTEVTRLLNSVDSDDAELMSAYFGWSCEYDLGDPAYAPDGIFGDDEDEIC